jgi:hypothetical protein
MRSTSAEISLLAFTFSPFFGRRELLYNDCEVVEGLMSIEIERVAQTKFIRKRIWSDCGTRSNCGRRLMVEVEKNQIAMENMTTPELAMQIDS